MALIKEFKEFALKGNVVDMAVGVIIGTAFGKIVSSLVADVLMPPIGKALGGVSFSSLFIALQGSGAERPASLEAAKAAGVATVNYGVFIQAVLDFTIVALVLFLLIKGMNKLKRAEAPAPATTRDCPECLSKIPIAARRCAHCTTQVAAA